MDDGTGHVEEVTLEPTSTVRSRRPRALWGVLAAVAVGAGALVVTSVGDDGAERPGLPVALGSSGRSEGAMAADALWAPVTYVAGPDLPVLGGEAPAYRLSSAVTEAQVRALADALGVEGDVVHDGPGWTVSGTGGTVGVYEGGAAQWWFSSTESGGTSSSGSASGSAGSQSCAPSPDGATADCVAPTETTVPACVAADDTRCPVTECRADAKCIAATTTTVCGPGADCVDPSPPPDCPVSSDGGVIPCPTEPIPPVNLPSKDEARAIALDLLAATGVDVEGADVVVDGPYDAWYVTVEPVLDGVPSGLQASVSVGSGGEVITAGGSLADPERLGDYPVLDTRATIDRANAEPTIGPAYRGGVGMDVPVSAAEGGTTATADTVGGSTEPSTTTDPYCKTQADGSEICASTQPGIACPDATAPSDVPLGAPETTECAPPLTDPGVVPEPVPDPGVVPEPVPEPTPIEVVLVDAEPSLVLLGALDGTTDAYLVPAYRFTDADGGRVDLPAVAAEALITPSTTETTAIPPGEPPVTPTVAPDPCEVSVEEDASGTTQTIQPNPDCLARDPQRLEEGQQPEIGVGYYVDVDLQCADGTFSLGGRVWRVDDGSVAEWGDSLTAGERYEGGTFTLDSPDHGTFVGDAAATKVAEFRPLGPAEDIFCTPEPRP